MDKEECIVTNHSHSPSITAYTISPTTQVNMAADGYDGRDTSRTMTLTPLWLHLLLLVCVRLLMAQRCGRWTIHRFTYHRHRSLMIGFTLLAVKIDNKFYYLRQYFKNLILYSFLLHQLQLPEMTNVNLVSIPWQFFSMCI